MPKILNNLREQLLEETRREIRERGYKATTIRSVAAACHVAVGTVYNYFASKSAMISSYMEEDWRRLTEKVRATDTRDKKAYLSTIDRSLREFASLHSPLFHDPDAEKEFSEASSKLHPELRKQLSGLILPVLSGVKKEEQGFLSQFLAESILTWSMSSVAFETLYAVIEKLI